MTTPTYWRRAELRRDEEDGRHRPVGWLELFFDLVFVVIIGSLASDLSHHLNADGLLHFGVLFMAVFWVWNSFTYYTERFETDGLENRLFTFLAILTVAGLAVWAPEGLAHNYAGFAGSYLAARGLNIVLWLRAGRHERNFLPIAARFASGYALAAVVIGASFATHGGARIALFALAVVLEFATPTTTVKQQGALPPLSRSKWPERFGLFTMIVLGETVAEVIHALSGDPKIVEGILGLAIGFGLWWVYFDFIARRPSRQQISTALGWVYLHLLTLLAITVVGAAIAETIAGGEANERFLLLSVGGAGVAMGVLEMTLDREDGEPTHPYLSPALKIVLGAVLVVVSFVDLDPIPALTACLISLAVPAFYGARVWYRREQSTP